jgi:hypothetical protein
MRSLPFALGIFVIIAGFARLAQGKHMRAAWCVRAESYGLRRVLSQTGRTSSSCVLVRKFSGPILRAGKGPKWACALNLQLSPLPKLAEPRDRSQTLSAPASGVLELDEDSVHVWFVDPSEVGLGEGEKVNEDKYGDLIKVLGDDELGRYNALVHGKRQDQADSFLLARSLLRNTLSRYCPSVSAREWHFKANQYGRPELWFGEGSKIDGKIPRELRSLRFNLSHCSGLVCCAMSLGRDVGIDAEPVQQRRYALCHVFVYANVCLYGAWA